MGSAILWAPFYLVGDVVGARDRRVQPTASRIRTSPRSPTARRSTGLPPSCSRCSRASIGGARAARDLADPRSWPAWWCCSARRCSSTSTCRRRISHACCAFAVALFVTVWLRVRACPDREWTVRGAIALGLSGALMALVREQDAILVAGPALDFALRTRAFCAVTALAGPRRGGRQLVAIAAAGSLAFGWPAPTALRLSSPERTFRAVEARHAQDDLDVAARAWRPGLAGARLPRLDAARRARDRRTRDPAPSRGSAAPQREWRICAARDGRRSRSTSAAASNRGRSPARSGSGASWRSRDPPDDRRRRGARTRSVAAPWRVTRSASCWRCACGGTSRSCRSSAPA